MPRGLRLEPLWAKTSMEEHIRMVLQRPLCPHTISGEDLQVAEAQDRTDATGVRTTGFNVILFMHLNNLHHLLPTSNDPFNFCCGFFSLSLCISSSRGVCQEPQCTRLMVGRRMPAIDCSTLVALVGIRAVLPPCAVHQSWKAALLIGHWGTASHICHFVV